MIHRFLVGFSILILVCAIGSCSLSTSEPRQEAMMPKPLLRDFVGLNGHVQFKPELYTPVTRQVRSYHNIDWDVSKPGDSIAFPQTINGIDWDKHAYGKWKKYGYDIDASLQFQSFGSANNSYAKLWKSSDDWQHYYGFKLAKFFGPSGTNRLLSSVEIGNEPGKRFNDELYRKVFRNMATGIREADPNLKILTCAVHTGPANDYIKQLSQTFSAKEMQALYDVINVHLYAVKPEDNRQHPWERSYPEDPEISFLRELQDVVEWRNRNAPGKEIWLTEFGWDAVTEDRLADRKGGFMKYDWRGISDLQQAEYIVRALLCFTAMDIQRAYVYYFNDNNAPATHASSGITRKFKPKTSYWALKHLQETLGEYRFSRIVKQEEGEVYVYEYFHGSDANRLIWVAWSPTGNDHSETITISGLPGTPSRVERMPQDSTGVQAVEWGTGKANTISLLVNESPAYIFLGDVQ